MAPIPGESEERTDRVPWSGMGDESQPRLPGVADELFLSVEEAPPGRVRRTLRDLVAEASPSAIDGVIGPEPAKRSLTLGFPSSAQLARFVAGYRDHLLAGLGLGPLEVVGGGTKPARRHYHLGRSVTPDVLLRAADDTHVVVAVSEGAGVPERTPLVDELAVIGGLMGPVVGVLVTPAGLDETTTTAIWAHIAELRRSHDVHWLRYTISMDLRLD